MLISYLINISIMFLLPQCNIELLIKSLSGNRKIKPYVRGVIVMMWMSPLNH